MENPNRFPNKQKSERNVIFDKSQESSRQEQSRQQNSSKLDEEVDRLLSDELLKLSFVNRNAISEEMHGVRSLAVEETPQMINAALHTFQLELDKLHPSQKQAYIFIQSNRHCEIQKYHQQLQQQQHHIDSHRAMKNTAIPKQKYAAYVEDHNFRLRFLRCCLFHVKTAVLRFANYLNFIQTYWGDSYLTRPIQLSDFSAAEMKFMKKGLYQFLPFRDRRGRRVIVALGDGSDYDTTALKVFFYMCDCATRDSVESQRNGIVSFHDGNRWKGKINDSVFHKKVYKMFNSGSARDPIDSFHGSLPCRIVAVHICWPDSPILRMLSNLFLFQSKTFALRSGTFGSSALELNRLKFHTGSETEMRYSVKSHGVPAELLPLTGSNTIKLNCHNQWIRTRRLIEGENMKSITIVECPCYNDVVFRNGTQSMDNPGNCMFRDSILTYWEEKGNKDVSNADTSPRHSNNLEHPSSSGDTYNREFREQLVRDIEVHKKGRFLEWDKGLGVWVQIRDKVRIHRKVAMAFYNCTKRRYDNRTSSKSSTVTSSPSSKRRRGGSTSNVVSTHQGSFESPPRADLNTSSSSALAYQLIDKNNGECCFPSNFSSGTG